MVDRMRQGFYCGKVAAIRGRRALVRANVEGISPKMVMVQFDDPVTLPGVAGGTPLSVGWHAFPLADFDLDLEYDG